MRRADFKFPPSTLTALVSKPVVYTWKRGSTLLYVGLTTNFLSRLSRHNIIGRAEPLLKSDSIQIFLCRDYSQGERMARRLQRKHCPKYSTPHDSLDKTKNPRECLACGETFLPKRWWQRYCSKNCRNGLAK